MCSRLPLVVILGATGSGKTKLSLDLASKFGGEIISADSMQIYKGLDIITAKVKKGEQLLAPHHLIDILNPKETFTVLEYRNKAVRIIDHLISNNKLPILVGGTNYYVESVLWNILIGEVGEDINSKPWEDVHRYHELSSEVLHNKLKLLDPNMARRLHPNNKRKILRSLEVLHQKGRKHSEILEEQHSSLGGSKTSGKLRYPNSIILWLQCGQEELDKRLYERVDEMMKEGLIEELVNFHKHFKDPDFTKGIFQCIGFKEFYSYLSLTEFERNGEEGKIKLNECTELLKIATRQYARKQLRWINNRFLGRTDREVPPIYGLDTTNADEWDVNVTKKAIEIVQSKILDNPCSHENLPRIEIKSNPNSDDQSYFCNTCERTFIGELQWKCHLESKKHKRIMEKKKKLNQTSQNEMVDASYSRESPPEKGIRQAEECR